MAFLGQEEQLREFQDRFRFLYFVLFAMIGLLASRLVFLQILNGDKMRRYSEENRIKRVRIAAPRGMIFDRHGALLVDNRPAFDLEVTPQYLRSASDEEQKETIRLLASALDAPEAGLAESLVKNRQQPAFRPIKLQTDLSRDQVAKIETWKLRMPGVAVETEIQRTNLYGDIGSHLFGYLGDVSRLELEQLRKQGADYKQGDIVGKTGIERHLEEVLRGKDGEELVEVDALGRRIREKRKARVLEEGPSVPAVPGNNLVLTIDQDLQIAATEAFGDQAGSIVALDPATGEILAMVSRPSFDTTEFSRGVSPEIWRKLTLDEKKPLRDKTIQDHYMPGSVFKVVTAIAGLEDGIINESTTFHCPGVIRVGNRQYHCHKRGGHGTVNVVTAIAQSCDIFFYRVAQKLKSVDVIADWAHRFGLGNLTGVALSREIPGLIPTEAWKERRFGKTWAPGETLSVAIGQSFVLTTNIQLASLYGSIANGGTLHRPYFLKAVESPEGKILKTYEPEILRKSGVSEKTLSIVRQGLWGVVNSPFGTAYWQRLPGIDFAGKTGTSQVIRIAAEKIYEKCTDLPYRHRHHGLFAGFAPVDKPAIAVAVIAEHGCSGSRGAAPIARAVIQRHLEKVMPEVYGQKALAARGKAPAAPPAGVDETEDLVAGGDEPPAVPPAEEPEPQGEP